MQNLDIRKGESIFIDFPLDGEDGTSVTIPATMLATYTVVDSDGGAVESGSLAKGDSDQQFELRITDAMTVLWAEGTLSLDVLANDSAEGYADYIFSASIAVTP